jgi:predicted dehydrogenase
VQTWEFNAPDTSWEVEFAEFASAVRERRQPLGNLDDALANLTIIEKLYGLGKS